MYPEITSKLSRQSNHGTLGLHILLSQLFSDRFYNSGNKEGLALLH